MHQLKMIGRALVTALCIWGISVPVSQAGAPPPGGGPGGPGGAPGGPGGRPGGPGPGAPGPSRHHGPNPGAALLGGIVGAAIGTAIVNSANNSNSNSSNSAGQTSGSNSMGTPASVQTKLKDLGYYSGDIDGRVGPGTKNAIITYQTDYSLPVTGRIDPALLDSLGLK